MATECSQHTSSLNLPSSQKRLTEYVRVLGNEIGERNIWHQNQLDSAGSFIKETWKAQGYEIKSQQYLARGVSVENLEIEIPGQRHPNEIIIIGAHYDSVRGSPGANDNGSGVAALLELSSIFLSIQSEKTIRFVAFVNEEPPFFLTRKMGSRVYAARSRKNKEQIKIMISLEILGFYSDQPGSQSYPFPLSFFYPDTANFIAFVGNLRWRKLVMQSLGKFRRLSDFPAFGVAAPFWFTGVGWSDHWAFWREGYPAIMLTDTAFFRYEYYHTIADTPDKLVYDKMAQAVNGISLLIDDFAGIIRN